MTTTKNTQHSRRRHMMAVMLLSTAAALGGALHPAIATAEREWDVVAYDECIKQHPNAPYGCCYKTGGEWSGDDETGKCVAPPANSVQVPPGSSQPQGRRGPVAIVNNPAP